MIKQLAISIKDLPIFVRLGYFEKERVVGQNILISIKAQLSIISSQNIQDDLKKTVNYAELIYLMDELFKNREIKLIETVVDEAGEKILSNFDEISSLDIEVKKPILPDDLGQGALVSVCGKFERESKVSLP